ncbi:putative nuclease HARBI1 [Zerene cesonia]|uniref:putative nuclease HARBI1 n=1 Tax=Zerene cesonia TaxID=33412 RepID=UPI0018E5A34D|nr:putative nuclease HARBI1 [Zerene cesonia]
MAEKPPEEGYISVVDEDPEFFALLKWDSNQSHKQHEVRSLERAKSPEKTMPRARDEVDPFDLNDLAFIEAYRVPKDIARSLCEELKPVMPDSIKSIEFSVESKVLATLSFYATGKYQKSIAGKTDPSVTQYFVASAVTQVTEAMNHPTIVKKYIHFPHLRNERDVIKSRFYMKYRIPNIVGCVDCMHVPIARPEEDHKRHFNKSYHSKKVQIICDSDQNIISVDASPGGSLSHDAILNKHAVRNDLESLNIARDVCWLIGGAHYTPKQYIMTPLPKITKKTPISPEKYYTNLHSQTHTAVTDTIKQLKSRWKCLQATCNKQFDPTTVSMIIVACCILHNICNKRGLPAPQMGQAEERLELMKQKVANAPVSKKRVEDPSGVQVRNSLIERLWNERSVADCAPPKKRMARKERESQPVQMPQQQMQEDPSKRARIMMNNPYGLGVGMAPGWGHYPQH